MTRLLLVSTALLPGLPAQAHVGHIGAAAGHDHWVAGIAIGTAIGVAIWGALKGRKDPDTEEEEVEAGEEECEEEPA